MGTLSLLPYRPDDRSGMDVSLQLLSILHLEWQNLPRLIICEDGGITDTGRRTIGDESDSLVPEDTGLRLGDCRSVRYQRIISILSLSTSCNHNRTGRLVHRRRCLQGAPGRRRRRYLQDGFHKAVPRRVVINACQAVQLAEGTG